MAKRPIIDELVEGVAAMKSQREGKLTLRTYKVGPAPLPKVDSKLIKDARKKLRCSPAVFARRLPINERTLDKWEQPPESMSISQPGWRSLLVNAGPRGQGCTGGSGPHSFRREHASRNRARVTASNSGALESFPFHGLSRGMFPVYVRGWARGT